MVALNKESKYLLNIHTRFGLLDELSIVFLNQPNKKQIQGAIFIIGRVSLSLNTLETAKLSLFFPDILFLDNCSAYFLICTKNVLKFRLMVSRAI